MARGSIGCNLGIALHARAVAKQRGRIGGKIDRPGGGNSLLSQGVHGLSRLDDSALCQDIANVLGHHEHQQSRSHIPVDHVNDVHENLEWQEEPHKRADDAKRNGKDPETTAALFGKA